jgi:transcription antitermination protein NusB
VAQKVAVISGPRRRAREIALQILVQTDVSPDLDAREALRLYFDHLAEEATLEEDAAVSPARGQAHDRALVEELVGGVCEHRAELDQTLQEMSRNWRLERMALVERNVIRLALYEMKFVPSVPTNVALNEAIELAKRFGTAEGAAFVNGLLDRAATELQLRR